MVDEDLTLPAWIAVGRVVSVNHYEQSFRAKVTRMTRTQIIVVPIGSDYEIRFRKDTLVQVGGYTRPKLVPRDDTYVELAIQRRRARNAIDTIRYSVPEAWHKKHNRLGDRTAAEYEELVTDMAAALEEARKAISRLTEAEIAYNEEKH